MRCESTAFSPIDIITLRIIIENRLQRSNEKEIQNYIVY